MKEKVVYWLTGSQTLYGDDVLAHVAQHSEEMANYVNEHVPVTVKYLTTCKSSEEIVAAVKKVNADDDCIGIITWCHTFSPAKMWIKGLKMLQKPMCHFATQYNERLPYDTIDMDFMNENQAAHGDREFGYIVSRLRMDNKVIVGYYKDPEALKELASWCKVAAGYAFSKQVKVCRFSDNMRNVAVTEGDKVAAHIEMGWEVDYYPVGDLVDVIDTVTDAEVDAQMAEYATKYTMGTDRIDVVREQAKYEIAIDKFCKENGGYIGIVDHFGALHGMNQLPGSPSRICRARATASARKATGRSRRSAPSCSTWQGRRAPVLWKTTPTTLWTGSASARTCSKFPLSSLRPSPRSRCIRSASAASPIPPASSSKASKRLKRSPSPWSTWATGSASSCRRSSS